MERPERSGSARGVGADRFGGGDGSDVVSYCGSDSGVKIDRSLDTRQDGDAERDTHEHN
jgi:hypothetical protein